jgi:predicted TIM-barrel enzyme
VTVLEDAVRALYERKVAVTGADVDENEVLILGQDAVITRLLVGSGVDPRELAELQERATMVILAGGLNVSTLPALIAGGWMEGFLLGRYTGMLAAER